jgi:thioredoxin 1
MGMENLTEANFQKTIAKKNVAVKFWAEWCGPCKMLTPLYEELSREMKDVHFTAVNVDKSGSTPSNAGVRGVPTIVLFSEGKEVGRVVGFVPKDALKKKIRDAFE